MRFQPQKMLLICILLFLQCSYNSTMFVEWLPYIILKNPISKSKKNEVPTAKNAPHLYFILSTVFPQLHHVCGMVTIYNFFLNPTAKFAPHLLFLELL